MGWGDTKIGPDDPPGRNTGCPPEVATLLLAGWLLFRVTKLLVRMVRHG